MAFVSCFLGVPWLCSGTNVLSQQHETCGPPPNISFFITLMLLLKTYAERALYYKAHSNAGLSSTIATKPNKTVSAMGSKRRHRSAYRRSRGFSRSAISSIQTGDTTVPSNKKELVLSTTETVHCKGMKDKYLLGLNKFSAVKSQGWMYHIRILFVDFEEFELQAASL